MEQVWFNELADDGLYGLTNSLLSDSETNQSIVTIWKVFWLIWGCPSGQIVCICLREIVDGYNIYLFLWLVGMHKCTKLANLVLYLFYVSLVEML